MSTVRAARTTNELISQMPGESTATVAMLKRLGLWTAKAHDSSDERRAFVTRLANLGPEELANEQGYWSSEAGRITELHGFLSSLKVRTDIEGKIAAAGARNRVRNNSAYNKTSDGKDKKLTTGEINDLAELDSALKDARSNAVLVESTIAAVAAAKEATLLYLNTISREITRRGDLSKARF